MENTSPSPVRSRRSVQPIKSAFRTVASPQKQVKMQEIKKSSNFVTPAPTMKNFAVSMKPEKGIKGAYMTSTMPKVKNSFNLTRKRYSEPQKTGFDANVAIKENPQNNYPRATNVSLI